MREKFLAGFKEILDDFEKGGTNSTELIGHTVQALVTYTKRYLDSQSETTR